MKNESFDADLRSLQRAIAFGAPSGRMSMTPPAQTPSDNRPEISLPGKPTRKTVQRESETRVGDTPAHVA
jgi:hypothetical protein